MLVRVLQFLVGVALGGGGGYLAWLNRNDFGAVFPPGPAGPPWMLVLGVLALASGIVFLVSAVHPRPNQRAAQAVRAQEREAQLNEADAYYAEAGRAADRDWRSGDIAPPAAPVPPAPPAAPAPVAPPPPPEPVSAPTPVAAPVVVPAPPPEPPPPPAPVLTPPPAPVLTPPPAAPAPAAAPPASFPSTASLTPIPAAPEPPPAPVAAPASAPPPADAGPYAGIRAALQEGKLDEAEAMLEAARDTAKGVELAELTGLAGDHAVAAGRESHAKWLWRLAIKRFGEAGALEGAAARAVAESLRTTG